MLRRKSNKTIDENEFEIAKKEKRQEIRFIGTCCIYKVKIPSFFRLVSSFSLGLCETTRGVWGWIAKNANRTMKINKLNMRLFVSECPLFHLHIPVT